MRIFLDANILFSAADKGSPLRQMLTVLEKHAVLITSPYAITEAQRNIAAKRPHWMPGLHKLIDNIAKESGQAHFEDVTLNISDRPILSAAIAAKCSHLLTGDFRHFGPLMGKIIGGATIVSTRMLAEE